MTARRDRRLLVVVGLVVAAALVGAAIGALVRITDGSTAARGVLASELHGQATWRAGERPAPAFSLRDQSGRLVSPAALRGRAVLLTFLDSRCVDQCPIAGRGVSDVGRILTAGEQPAVVIVGLNPAADTPAGVRAAARRFGLAPGWRWLTGSPAELRQVWRRYGIVVRTLGDEIAHDTAVYLVDPRGFLRAGYLVPFSPPVVARDVERVLRSE